MTEEQLKELKKFIVEVGTILEQKLDQITFKLENLQREVECLGSNINELFGLIQEMD